MHSPLLSAIFRESHAENPKDGIRRVRGDIQAGKRLGALDLGGDRPRPHEGTHEARLATFVDEREGKARERPGAGATLIGRSGTRASNGFSERLTSTR